MGDISANTLREWFKEHPEGALLDIEKAFGLKSDVTTKLLRLRASGELILHGEYQYLGNGEVMPGPSEVKQTAMWRVIRGLAKSSRIVNFDEIVILAEVSRAYALKYIGFLIGQGFLARRATGLAVLDKAMKHPETPYSKFKDMGNESSQAKGATQDKATSASIGPELPSVEVKK
jgi:hypothetical protein